MAWIAVVLVLGQGVVAFALLRAVRSLGQFTEAQLAAHKSNMLVRQQLEYQIDQVGEVKDLLKLREVLDSERAASRAANFVQYDPHSDREKMA